MRRLTGRIFLFIASGALSMAGLVPGCRGSVASPGSAGGARSVTGNGGAGQSGAGGSAAGSGRVNGAGRGGAPVITVEPGSGGAQETTGGAGAAGVPTIDRDDACALSTDTVEALPPVLELVIDTSGSMDWPPGWAPVSADDSKPPGATKWEITRAALTTAVDSLGDDVALGANFFPNTTDDDESMCLRNVAGLPIARLGSASSATRAAWLSALEDVVPSGATPTEGAYLFGLEQLARTELPGNRFILLITDGTPTCTIDCECTEDNLPVDSRPLIDAAARALDDGVLTFVIGSPGSEETRDVLSELASQGGTAKADCSDAGPVYCHLDMSTEPDLAQGLARALEQVTAGLRSCEYAIPEPPDGRTFDPDLVNVLLTPSNEKTETVLRDPSKADCNEGWQYSADGDNVVLCGEACEAAKSDVGAKVEVLIGCETALSEPR